ncbi:hypothetical protein K3G63_12495 [Hymenobacter sp. HSC-4F20]|uniref:dienelactone hydrolase family protein n=1 Tax=Hymenobacter sp. HSC-4F20 TaxID=2864135 RepID=UPI001C73AEA5|nr:hypothetical protein [Hymenobacter sp. HSC-4F20]MBX0291264.1 hypothetical protein [Hymenobacter sp. HSC-4F20]
MKPVRSISAVALLVVWGAAWVPLASCSREAAEEEKAHVPLPTGHYEGPVSYQGAELRVSLELEETASGQLQADISFPQVPGLEFEPARVSYQEPQLRLEQQLSPPGGISIQAVREGDFLRGVLSFDSVRADFVWVRRGPARSRGFREVTIPLRYGRQAQVGRLRLPEDTLPQHAALVLLAAPATRAAAETRAAYLARHGFVTLVAAAPVPTGPTDSVAYAITRAALTALRRQTLVDSARVGCWVRGTLAPLVSAAASRPPIAAFVVLEAAPAATRDQAAAYQPLSRGSVPTLALYAGQDTSVQAGESARHLRRTLGHQAGSQVRVYPQATAEFIQPGQPTPEGQWQWPKPAVGYWDELTEWLRRVSR